MVTNGCGSPTWKAPGRQGEDGTTGRRVDKSTSAFPVDEILSVLDEAGLVGDQEEPETGAEGPDSRSRNQRLYENGWRGGPETG